MIILGIDPGFDKTGYSIFEKTDSLAHGYVVSGLVKTSPKSTVQERIHTICSKIDSVLVRYKVTHVAMEQLFFFKNAKTVIAVAQTQGAILETVSRNNVPLSFLTPLQIKQAVTGYGQADKTSVWKMLQLQLGKTIQVSDDDESDAIACGFAYCILMKSFALG